jgi:hypothetical protein
MTGPDVEAGSAWRPDELAPRLAALQVPWAVVAGWADLWLGGEPREPAGRRRDRARRNRHSFLRPEIVRLFKAKHIREKDEADFLRAVSCLGARRRARLVDALRIAHPGHEWIDRLAT